jgi:hypothetical protein
MPKLTSVVDQLPEAAKEQILSWLECHPTRLVVEMIARPAPDGFGVNTHVTTLRRFYARHQASSSDGELEIAKLFDSVGSSPSIENATENLLREWAFQIATNPQKTNSAFKTLARWRLKLREQQQRERLLEIHEQRLHLERDKFEFNAARQALLHHESLGRILKEPNSDDEAKIQAARQQLFGRSISSRPPIGSDSSPNPSTGL